MGKKVAVAFVHGMGSHDKDFANEFMGRILDQCEPTCGTDVIVRPVHWSPAMQNKEEELLRRLKRSDQSMSWMPIRKMLIDLLADALAYQITATDRRMYDEIHARFAGTLARLAREAGADAPLCIVAHSLGAIIASNFIYDLQYDSVDKPLITEIVRASMADTPLERGETLTKLYTLGNPLALWSLRYQDFGLPIRVPSPPPAFRQTYPQMVSEWINIYDQDDVIGFPLKTLNAAYGEAVTADEQINVGGLVEFWNPGSHTEYDNSQRVINLIAAGIIQTWQTVNA